MTSHAVLVVDDEPGVRGMAVDMFEALGVTVYEAYNGRDALVLLRRHPEITVLFSDVRMPGLSGAELAAEAYKLRPDLKVILTSAYVGENAIEDAPYDAFIAKPYRIEHLEAVIAKRDRKK
jgi:CheY-like chemotaxis protein